MTFPFNTKGHLSVVDLHISRPIGKVATFLLNWIGMEKIFIEI